MKLLLTSAGLTNKTISNALFDLVGKKPEDISLVYVPTASNIEKGDKSWAIEDLMDVYKLNFKSVAIADISAVPESVWRPQFEEADVLFFEGGDTHHLMGWINKSGLKDLLPDFMKTKVWCGISAGSMVTTPDLATKISQAVYDEDLDKLGEMVGLNFVDFYFLPHLNSQWFPKLTEENIRKLPERISRKIYALDDQGALKVVDGKVEIVTEGKYLELN